MHTHDHSLKARLQCCLFLASVLTLGSCAKDNSIVAPITTPFAIIQDPTQYGTPFANVPDPHDATIYQVNIRTFSSGKNFQGVIARLDSIKNLGINVIYLMPIYPVGALKAINSPYCVKDYRGVNPEFGSLTDLRALIEGAHNRGMTVILDWVANHTSWDNAWIPNKSWYAQDISGNIVSPNGWTDVAQLNFSDTEMRYTMIKALKYWILTANCDGFRCDFADGPPASFWKQAIDTLRTIKTHKLLLLAEGTRADHFISGFDYTFGFRFYDQLKSIFQLNDAATNIDNLNTSEYINAGTNNLVVRYTTNHDVNSSDGTPLDLFGGSSGSLSAFVVAAYMKGIPMIYNGQEVGTSYRLTFPFTTTTINWTSNPSMTAKYKQILAFRNSSVAIRRGALASFSNTNVCAFTKKSGTETALVICNLRNANSNFTLPSTIANTTWQDAFTNASVTLGTQVALSPYEYLVLKK